MKTLSVILVSYNVRVFLEQALVSIQKALGAIDHEIIVVDNDSTDNSAEWVEKKFPSVRLFKMSCCTFFPSPVSNNRPTGEAVLTLL